MGNTQNGNIETREKEYGRDGIGNNVILHKIVEKNIPVCVGHARQITQKQKVVQVVLIHREIN